MKLGEFFIDIVVDAGNGELTLGSLVKSMGELEIASLGEVAALLKFADTMVSINNDARTLAASLHGITGTTDINIESLQKWEAAAKLAGWSGSALAASVTQISQNLVDLHANRSKALLPLHTLLPGLDLSTNDPFILLQEIRKNKTFRSLSTDRKSGVLRASGLPAEWLLVLQKSDKELADFFAHAPIMTRGTLGSFTTINKEFARLELTVERIREHIAKWQAPGILLLVTGLNTLLDRMDTFLVKHKTEVTEFMKILGVSALRATAPVTGPVGLAGSAFADILEASSGKGATEKTESTLGKFLKSLDLTGPYSSHGTVPNKQINLNAPITVNVKGSVDKETIPLMERVFKEHHEKIRHSLNLQLNNSYI